MWRVLILALLALVGGPAWPADPASLRGADRAARRPSSARSGSPRRRSRPCAPRRSRCGCRGWRSCCASSPGGSRRSSTRSARPRPGSTSWWPIWTRGCRGHPGEAPRRAAPRRPAQEALAAPEPPRPAQPSIIAPDESARQGYVLGTIPQDTLQGQPGRRLPRRNPRSRRGLHRRGPTRPTGRRSTSCRRAAGPMPSRPSNSFVNSLPGRPTRLDGFLLAGRDLPVPQGLPDRGLGVRPQLPDLRPGRAPRARQPAQARDGAGGDGRPRRRPARPSPSSASGTRTHRRRSARRSAVRRPPPAAAEPAAPLAPGEFAALLDASGRSSPLRGWPSPCRAGRTAWRWPSWPRPGRTDGPGRCWA